MTDTPAPASDAPQHRYGARLANEIEAKWQDRWERDHTFWAPNPTGPLSDESSPAAGKDKLYVLDMFPYPSGEGLHVGHPVGYIGTDVYARFMRMNDFNVLHAMGYDSFGLPAEQFAVSTGSTRAPRSTRTSPPCAASSVPSASPTIPGGASTPRMSATTGGRSGSSSRSSTRGSTSTRAVPVRSPSSPKSSRPARVHPTATPTPTSWRGSTSTRRRAPPWSIRTGSRTSTRRSSTGAPRSAPCWPTRKSPPTGGATAATIPCSAAP